MLFFTFYIVTLRNIDHKFKTVGKINALLVLFSYNVRVNRELAYVLSRYGRPKAAETAADIYNNIFTTLHTHLQGIVDVFHSDLYLWSAEI